ncbi:hypothetical protein LJC21_02935 [Bacteroides sp. OttesenSCG-928-E20]|nr:hypothetical protein [Bacteroides sp. OttesenSCG-928-E20]MDL2304236.1 hypothetical protein [Bacteroides sp. OttesenSCG-928-D19]
MKKVLFLVITTLLLSFGVISCGNKNSSNMSQNFNKRQWTGSKVRNGNRTTEYYKINIYQDGTATIQETGSGEANYSVTYKGEWSRKSQSFADKSYSWIYVHGAYNEGRSRRGKEICITERDNKCWLLSNEGFMSAMQNGQEPNMILLVDY